MSKATIRLFKALPISNIKLPECIKVSPEKIKELHKKTIKKGFIFSPEVIRNYSNYDELIKLVEKVYGISGEKANSTFHKSWRKIKTASIEQLVIEQIVHYFTTYGFEELGIYNEESVYIPNEKLEIPELKEGITLTIIKGLTKKELKEKLLNLLNSGIALKEETINDVVDVALFVDINEKEVEAIKNKETKIILYEYLNIIPENPIEFLRFIVYVATDTTLLIKSKDLIDKIKEKKNIKIIKLFRNYEKQHGLEKLAEIFLRFKPLWLSFRQNREMKTIINKVRKLAVKHHRPMPEDYLNCITAKIKKGEKIDWDRLEKELKGKNVFRKVRLAYALKFRTKSPEAIIYRIRNGKSYSTDFHFSETLMAKMVLNNVLDSIVEDIKPNIKGKKFYLPTFINYSLPATEKQFSGNFPSGSYIKIPKDMVVGVHWENVGHNSIDLDLSAISTEGKFGWDGNYRNDERDILFSGDITDAPKPKGATELFYVERQLENSFIFMLNYYNYDAEIKVPFKIIVAKQDVKNFGENYMINPNNIVSVVQSEISQKQKILGLLITTTKESRFYFVETSIGKSITSSNSKPAANSRKYLMDFYQNSIELKDILERAGAKFVDSKDDCEVDLSPEALEKNTILDLLIKK